MGQTDNGSVFGGLTQMVVPAGAPPTPAAPPPPSFDHLNTIQVAPPTSARAQNQTQPNTTVGQPQGLMESGNLDLNNRPVVHNEDGTHSSEYSISFGTDKGEVLVPTVVNGRFLTPSGKKPPEKSAEEQQMFDNARRHYENTGEHMGIFDTPENADAYANQVHNRGNSPAMPVDRTLYRKLPTSTEPTQPQKSLGEKAAQVVQDIVPLSHEAKTLNDAVNTTTAGQQVGQFVHEQLSHPERFAMGGVEAEGAGELGEVPGEIEGAVQKFVNPEREPNYAYRSRDIGEQGVPANENSHAQLTSSEDQARLYTQPGQRDQVTGKPQELVRVDLNKLRPSDYSTKKMDEGVNWHKIKRDVPEELVEKMPVDYHAIGKQQGVDFRGVQKGYGVTSDVAVFQDPQSGTSVGVPLEKWSPKTLAEHIAQARQRMAGTSNKPSLLGKQ